MDFRTCTWMVSIALYSHGSSGQLLNEHAQCSACSWLTGTCGRLLKDVNIACLEANDTVKYLRPLRKYLEKMNSMDDFTALIELFKPMFHTMLLIWKHSGYYNTSAKMVTLIREMCNDLIMQACKFVPGQCLSRLCHLKQEFCYAAWKSFLMFLQLYWPHNASFCCSFSTLNGGCRCWFTTCANLV